MAPTEVAAVAPWWVAKIAQKGPTQGREDAADEASTTMASEGKSNNRRRAAG